MLNRGSWKCKSTDCIFIRRCLSSYIISFIHLIFQLRQQNMNQNNKIFKLSIWRSVSHDIHIFMSWMHLNSSNFPCQGRNDRYNRRVHISRKKIKLHTKKVIYKTDYAKEYKKMFSQCHIEAIYKMQSYHNWYICEIIVANWLQELQ